MKTGKTLHRSSRVVALASVVTAALSAGPAVAGAAVSDQAAFGEATKWGAVHAQRLNAENVLVSECMQFGRERQLCALNVFDDDYDEGGLDCYWYVEVSAGRNGVSSTAFPRMCVDPGHRRSRDRGRPTKRQAFAASGQFAARQIDRLDAQAVMIEYCNRSGSRRTCPTRVYRRPDDTCNWTVTVSARAHGRLTTRARRTTCSFSRLTAQRALAPTIGAVASTGLAHHPLKGGGQR